MTTTSTCFKNVILRCVFELYDDFHDVAFFFVGRTWKRKKREEEEKEEEEGEGEEEEEGGAFAA